MSSFKPPLLSERVFASNYQLLLTMAVRFKSSSITELSVIDSRYNSHNRDLTASGTDGGPIFLPLSLLKPLLIHVRPIKSRLCARPTSRPGP